MTYELDNIPLFPGFFDRLRIRAGKASPFFTYEVSDTEILYCVRDGEHKSLEERAELIAAFVRKLEAITVRTSEELLESRKKSERVIRILISKMYPSFTRDKIRKRFLTALDRSLTTQTTPPVAAAANGSFTPKNTALTTPVPREYPLTTQTTPPVAAAADSFTPKETPLLQPSPSSETAHRKVIEPQLTLDQVVQQWLQEQRGSNFSPILEVETSSSTGLSPEEEQSDSSSFDSRDPRYLIFCQQIAAWNPAAFPPLQFS